MGRETEYCPFPNQPWRNAMQSAIEVRLASRLLRVPKGLRILEVGCGRGIALPAIIEHCHPSALTGVDIDAELIRIARESLSRKGIDAELVTADLRTLPFATGSFDLVVDFGTCYHVGGRDAAIAEVQRVLTPGGMFFYESPLSQALAHPTRTTWRRLPWQGTRLRPIARAGLWSARIKLSGTE